MSLPAFCSWILLGFTISLYEFSRTIETLWSAVSGTLIHHLSSTVRPSHLPTADFVTEHPEFVSPNSAMNFISDNGGESYNLCHCAFLHPFIPL